MTTRGRREKCLPKRSEKGHLRALRAHQMRRSSGLYESWNRRLKMEIPAKTRDNVLHRDDPLTFQFRQFVQRRKGRR